MSKGKRPHLALVGGFLGAGKTTLILKAVQLLAMRGLRAAVITNDQDAGLVDTRHALAEEVPAREVAGGCFCCRFSDLIEASEALRVQDPDVIFAEPVGSCVDLSATILQPLKAYHRAAYRLAPLTVLIDPAMAERAFRDELNSEMDFLFRRQLAEADLVCLSKQDVFSGDGRLPFPIDFRLSAKTGAGIDEWLDVILEAKRVVGAHLLDVDYKRYAQAEAALGWLNLHAEIRSPDPISPAALCGPLLDGLQASLEAARLPIAHLKIFDQGASGWIKVSISGNGQSPVPEGDLLAERVHDHELAINLRAIADPEQLRQLVEEAVGTIPGSLRILHLRAFRPAEPRPEHRFATLQA